MSYRARFTRPALLALACAVALASVAWAASPTDKDKTAKAASKADPAQDPAMAEMMKYAMPGPAHELLKSMEGEWRATVKSWMAPGEPAVSEGTSSHRLILGGRYVEQRFKSTFMDQPFEGVGLTGFDNRKGRYTSLWLDNFSTEVMSGEGTWDAAAKTLTMTSTGPGPDGKPTTIRSVTKVVDDDTHVFSMYAPMEGKETLAMEITYKRVK
jgi:hypothetical protein